MAAFAEDDGKLEGISYKELMGLAIGRLAGFHTQAEAVLLVGVDNMNAVLRAVRGEPRIKFARRPLTTFLSWRVKGGVEVAVFYFRTSQTSRRMKSRGLKRWT